MYFLIILAAILADQAIKFIVKSNMNVFDSIPLIDGFLSLTYIQNTGAAFSIFQDKSNLLLVANLILIVVMFVFLFLGLKKEGPLALTGLALIIGGGLGNIADRVMQGFVVDYIHILDFPIFNLADICVCVGAFLLILYFIFFERKRKQVS